MATFAISAGPFSDLYETCFQLVANVSRLQDLVLHDLVKIGYDVRRTHWTIRDSSAVVLSIKDWVTQYTADHAQVHAFCDSHKLTWYAKVGVELAKSCFPEGSKLALRIDKDPESEEESLVIDMAVKSGTANVLQYYNRFVDQWVTVAPPNATSRINLTLHFA